MVRILFFGPQFCDAGHWGSMAGIKQLLDWLLILDMEVSLVWKSHWNATKSLYFMVRYLSFIDASVMMYREFTTFSTIFLHHEMTDRRRPIRLCPSALSV